MRLPCLIGCVAVMATACTTLDPVVPPSFDLTGSWALDPLASDDAPDLDAIRRREDRKVARGRQADAGGSAAFVTQDFPILTATTVTIEQDAASMGIRYDGGDYRDVSWGERERDFWTVRAGWLENALVVRSTRGGTQGIETFTLEDGQLRVAVRVKTEGEDVEAVRVFLRQ